MDPGRKREGKNIFGELLTVLRKRQEEDQDMGVQDEVAWNLLLFLLDINVFLRLMFTLSSAASSVVTPSLPKMRR